MISHRYKCIFIHIPRTGGSSIERALCGRDWWEVEQNTKHIIASQAKRLYEDYWDDYFKFAVIRNPWSRMVSCLKYPGYFAGELQGNHTFKEFLQGYMKTFGAPVTVEHDRRFHDHVKSQRAVRNSVYLNMLDEDLDYIVRFEQLEKGFQHIKGLLGTKDLSLPRLEVSSHRRYQDYYDAETRQIVRNLYQQDIHCYGYEFDN
jgi:hypothetical protein